MPIASLVIVCVSIYGKKPYEFVNITPELSNANHSAIVCVCVWEGRCTLGYAVNGIS